MDQPTPNAQSAQPATQTPPPAQQPAAPSAQNSPKSKSNKMRMIILVVALLAILGIGGYVFMMGQSANNTQKETTETEKPSSSNQQNVTTSEPKIEFETLTTALPAPQVPAASNIYKLKKNYTVDEAKQFAGLLELTEYKEKGTSMFIYNNDDNDLSKGYMMFDRMTGSFTYQSYGTITVGGGTPVQVAQAFLTKLGIADPTVTCPVTYQRTGVEGVTFVECHRDWQRVGLPIVNMVGLFNMPETARVDSLAVGIVDANAPEDLAVVNTSTKQDGKRRPDDFNTATVAIGSKGNVLMVKSNLRKIESATPIAGQVVIPDDAWKKFAANQADVAFVVPAGAGTTDLQRVFPQNKATAPNGNVTDYEVVYVENGQSQEYLTPMYIVRGTAKTNGGYDVKFVQGVAASKLGLTSATGNMSQAVAGDSTSIAQARDRLQLLSFTITVTPGETGDVVTTGDCIPEVAQLAPQSQLTGVGLIGPWTIPPFEEEDDDEVGQYYLASSGAQQPWPDVVTIMSQFDTLGLPDDQATERRDLDDFSEDWAEAEGTDCPLRISGGSPTVFAYGVAGDTYKLSLDRDVTYSYPAANDDSWSLEIKADGSVKANGVDAEYVYYEYVPVEFDRPAAGWNVEKGNLESLARKIAGELTLTSEEAERLVFELNHAAYGVEGDSLYVAPISRAEVEAKLPLNVAGTSNVERVHFYVGEATGSVSAAVVSPVSRSGSMILELGAAKGE